MRTSSDEIVNAAKFLKKLVRQLRPRLAAADIPEAAREAAGRIIETITATRARAIASLWKNRPAFRDDHTALLYDMNTRRDGRGGPQTDIVARVAAMSSATLSLRQAVETRVPFHARHHASVCWCWLVTAADYDLPVFAVSGSTEYSEGVRRKAEAASTAYGLTGIWGIVIDEGGPSRIYLLHRYYDPPGSRTASKALPPDFRDGLVRRGDAMIGHWMLENEPDPFASPR